MIPVIGYRITNETIESVTRQECTNYEILILRNDIQGLLQGMDIVENSLFYHGHLIQEIYIRKKGKDNALNVGISYARNPLVCVIDADFVLGEDALYNAVKHFQSDKVVAVGGRLIVKREDIH